MGPSFWGLPDKTSRTLDQDLPKSNPPLDCLDIVAVFVGIQCLFRVISEICSHLFQLPHLYDGLLMN
jgi:hypothetical protein